jgi:hypothetical protein
MFLLLDLHFKINTKTSDWGQWISSLHVKWYLKVSNFILETWKLSCNMHAWTQHKLHHMYTEAECTKIRSTHCRFGGRKPENRVRSCGDSILHDLCYPDHMGIPSSTIIWERNNCDHLRFPRLVHCHECEHTQYEVTYKSIALACCKTYMSYWKK